MYQSIWELERPSLTTPWPDVTPADFDNLRSQATGFLKKEIILSNGNLTKTVITSWATEEDAMKFLDDNALATEQISLALVAYCENNNITATRSIA
jgi:hypothetical protein